MGTFEVRGNARRTVNYDIAVINIDFIASEKTSTRASEKALEYCERFLEKVEKIGLNATNFSIEGDEIEANRYRDDEDVEAYRKIQIKIPFNMKIINAIRVILDDEKIDSIFELGYELSNEDKIRDELLNEALLDSKTKAEQLATALGKKIVGVKKLEAYNSSRDIEIINCIEMEHEDCDFGTTMLSQSNELKAKETTLTENIDVKWIIEK